MYQFDESGRLRRAFVSGLLYRTQGSTLAQLRRERTETETTLVRRDLTPLELIEFQDITRATTAVLRHQLAAGQVVILRQVPTNDAQLINDFTAALDQALHSPEFLAPAIAGKK